MKSIKILVLLAAICCSQITSGQKAGKESDKLVTITGKVLDSNKKPVEGAVFYIDNFKTSYVSKSNGSYKIKVSPSAVNLEVRSPDFGFSEIPINGQTDIDFILPGIPVNPEDKSADEVSSHTKSKKINTYSNIYQYIRGEVSGVVVSGKSIQIQQGHSFFGSSTPLFVVNGVIVPSIDYINPVEVQSITVLKGSSAAIYGVQGANGVLSIKLINGSEKTK
jgi:TonB-dependent SusC/RagA subfamily outer membrane receptor